MLKRDQSIVTLIDVQEKLLRVMHEPELLEQNLSKLLRGMKVLDVPVLWLEQYPEGMGPTQSSLAEIMNDESPLSKKCFSACGLDPFNDQLESSGRKQVIVCGIETHVCVYQSVSDLLEAGYEVQVVADGVSSRAVSNRDYALRIMKGMGARLTTVEMVLFELLKTAGAEEFRQISRIIR